MGFTSVTAVLRAAGLAADRHHRPRAVFERLDGSVGRVESEARLIQEQELRLDVPLLAQVSRWDRLKDPLGVIGRPSPSTCTTTTSRTWCSPDPT